MEIRNTSFDSKPEIKSNTIEIWTSRDDPSDKETNVEPIVSDKVAYYFNTIVAVYVVGLVSIVGIVSNIVNIIVFIRQGVFKKHCGGGGGGASPSLFGLAVSDLASVTTVLWEAVSFYIVILDPPGLSWDPFAVHYLTGGWPHVMCGYFTRLVTAYVTLERCICVVFPFKMKTLFTPRRTMTVIICLFIFCAISVSPFFGVHSLQYRPDPATNRSKLVLVPTYEHFYIVVWVVYAFNSIGVNLFSVITVLLCTIITVSRVKLSKSWRESVAITKSAASSIQNTKTSGVTKECPSSSPLGVSTTETPGNTHVQNMDSGVYKVGGKGDNPEQYKGRSRENESGESGTNKTNIQMSQSKIQKEKRLVKMITTISTIFLISYIPDLVYMVSSFIDTRIDIVGQFSNLGHIMFAMTFLCETISSSVNFMVYYRMSSRYKEEVHLMFGINVNK